MQLDQPFVTVSGPVCGADSMPLAVAKMLIDDGRNPMYSVFMQCVDIDRCAALMCYIQLTLWNEPAEIIVGDTLTMDYKEHWFTPAYYLFGWREKLAQRHETSHLNETFSEVQELTQTAINQTENKADDSDAKNETENSDQQLALFDIKLPSRD